MPSPCSTAAMKCRAVRDGDDVVIEIHAFDETNTRIRPDKIAAMIEEAGAGMVMLTGVQSNQFPRAMDIARRLREDAELRARLAEIERSDAEIRATDFVASLALLSSLVTRRS